VANLIGLGFQIDGVLIQPAGGRAAEQDARTPRRLRDLLDAARGRA
jgi:hypothetical protein